MDYDAGVASTVRTVKMMKEAFGFLIEELGFELTDSHFGQRESSVTFRSTLVRVQVHVDHLPLGVNVGVGLFEKKGQRTMVDEHGLVDVVRDQAPEEVVRLLAEVESREDALAVHAELLRRHAADLLRGERTRVPRLRRLRAAETRRENKETFGTSTGETPRFTGRPTLEELFADVTNEGRVIPRAYQAFWDYAYSLAKIGRFLDLGEKAVQAMLDEWDRL